MIDVLVTCMATTMFGAAVNSVPRSLDGRCMGVCGVIVCGDECVVVGVWGWYGWWAGGCGAGSGCVTFITIATLPNYRLLMSVTMTAIALITQVPLRDSVCVFAFASR